MYLLRQEWWTRRLEAREGMWLDASCVLFVLCLLCVVRVIVYHLFEVFGIS